MNTIYLIGLMGVGKTSAGRMLSNLTNKSFIDLDYEIEKASGLTVVNFFEERGESSFRSFESKLLKSFSKSEVVNIVKSEITLAKIDRVSNL